MTGKHTLHDPAQQARRDLPFNQHQQDPYQARAKPADPSVCPDCGVVFHRGRWQWIEADTGARSLRCPACSRIHDRVPAAFLTLAGDFFLAHRDEILHLIRNKEQAEKALHPLERIMAIDEERDDGNVEITFTGIHLAKSTGDALQHAYQGNFEFSYQGRDDIFHGTWRR